MQAMAAESRRRFAMARPFGLSGRAVARRAKVASGYAGQPPPLFELRRVRKRKGRALAKRRRIPLLFDERNLKNSLPQFIYFKSASLKLDV